MRAAAIGGGTEGKNMSKMAMKKSALANDDADSIEEFSDEDGSEAD